MLSDVTLIIPAHNRPERLKRLLDYYSKTEIHVVVPDSSDEPFEEISNYPQVVYKHQPKMQFLRKVNEILPYITTKYVLYCADDDFAVPSGIEAVVEYMEAHKEVESAQGHYLTFVPKKRKVEFSPRYIRFFDKKIIGKSGVERLHGYTDLYASSLYGVARAETFKRMYSVCFDAAGELRFTNLYLAEHYYNYFTLIHGNYATVPVFYSAREVIEGSATTSVVPFSDICTKPEYRKEYEGFVATLSEELAMVDGCSMENARKEILAVIEKPKYNASISFKQKLVFKLMKSGRMGMVVKLMNWRYRQKGLQAVKGMKSYPCSFMTPEKKEIIDCIQSH